MDKMTGEKKVNLNNADIKISAGFISQIPLDLPHIVFSGRSNVGKSTVINKITNRSSLARVSSSPGKTVTINFFTIDNKFYLVDLPGYGYAKRSDNEIGKWSELVEGYFKVKTTLLCVVQLIDLKVGPTVDDLMMINFMNKNANPYIIVATKSDKLNKTDKNAALEKLKGNKDIKKGTPIIAFSALNREGLDEINGYIKNLL